MNQKSYCKAITSIHGILKLRWMRNISIEGKIVVFKTLAISAIPNHTTDEAAKIQKMFYIA